MKDTHANQGVFCISLDFELHWGTFETVPLDEKGQKRFRQTRETIPQLLQLFDQYNIAATWAAVGMLFNEDATEWEASTPGLLPQYANAKVSSYNWVNNNKFTQHNQQFYFAPELVRLIASNSAMELGSHTYSHYYCCEPGQHAEAFEADMEMAIQKAKQQGFTLLSLVFPRNQFNPEYLEVCRRLGILTVRTNPDTWFWQPSAKESFFKKFVRAADNFIPINPTTSIPLHSLDLSQVPFQIPASRFLRPWHPNRLLNSLKIRRIKDEMTFAAKNNSLYHLWWHPHNFGTNPIECLADLKIILDHFRDLKKKYGMLSLHMNGLREYLIKNNS